MYLNSDSITSFKINNQYLELTYEIKKNIYTIIISVLVLYQQRISY